MIQLSLNYMDKSPKITLEKSENVSTDDMKTVKTLLIPGMQAEIDSCFRQYAPNSVELGKAVTKVMNHGNTLEKYKFIFMYYENQNHVGYYQYESMRLVNLFIRQPEIKNLEI